MSLNIPKLGIGLLKSSGSSADVDAIGWATAVTAGGGTYSDATLAALSAFIVSAKATGYWTKLKIFNPLAGDQLAAARIQWTNGVWIQVVSNSMSYVNEATGLDTVAPGVSNLDTGISADTLIANNTHVAVYNRGSSTLRSISGANASASSRIFVFHPESGGRMYSDQYDNNDVGGRNSAVISNTDAGFLVASRTAANSHKLFQNGVAIGTTSTTSGGTLPAVNLTVLNDGSGPLASYSFGAGLTATEVGLYYTHIQAFQTALGRQV